MENTGRRRGCVREITRLIERRVFDPESGEGKSLISGYSSAAMPNIRNRSRSAKAEDA